MAGPPSAGVPLSQQHPMAMEWRRGLHGYMMTKICLLKGLVVQCQLHVQPLAMCLCSNVATWDQFTSLPGSLPAVTMDEFPSWTLHYFTMKRKWQDLPPRLFERKMHSAWHIVGPWRSFPSLCWVGVLSTKTVATLSHLNSFNVCSLSVFLSCPLAFDHSSEIPLFTLQAWWPFREGWSHPEEFMVETQLYQSLKEWVGVGEAEVWATPAESQGWEWQPTAHS